MTSKSLGELAALVEGEVVGDPTTEISGAADIGDARTGDIVFAESPKHVEEALESDASAVIALPDARNSRKPLITVTNPKYAFARALEVLAPQPPRPLGIDSSASIGSDVEYGERVSIGHSACIADGVKLGDDVWIQPFAYIGRNVSIGSGSVIHPFVAVLDGVTIGSKVTIHPGAVIGADGFGYIPVGKEHYKIPQIGTVVIGDNVEIGANATIDRARTGKTEIGSGTKIDNQVHIAHNVTIGENCVIVAHVGISGSVRVGDGAILGGQVGVKDHVTIGEGSVVCARAGVIGNLPPGSFVSGFPARPHREQMRVEAVLHKLPEIAKTIRSLQERIAALEEDAG